MTCSECGGFDGHEEGCPFYEDSGEIERTKRKPDLHKVAMTPEEMRSLWLQGLWSYRRDSHVQAGGRSYVRKNPSPA